MNARNLLLGAMALIALALVVNSNHEDPDTRGEKPGASAVEPQAPTARPTPPLSPDAAALERATTAALKLGQSLKTRMTEAMGAGGPLAALDTCATEATTITTAQQLPGVRVGRSSRKLRNAANSAPDWVAAWLVSQDGKAAKDADALSSVLDTPTGRVARVVKPIGIEGTCLTCHGAAEQLSPDLRAALAKHYPADAATGYAEGDLRGALWAEVDVAPAIAK